MSLAAARSLSLSSSLSKLVVPPHRLAVALDWNKETGSLLNLSILREQIELAVAIHPWNRVEIQELPSIAVETEVVARKPKLKREVGDQLSSLMNDLAVCGLIVHWPVQIDGGWCGAACGRVLFTLEHLASNKSLVNRPICLWDELDCQPTEDSWGRSPIYARGTKVKTHHVASQEQYASRPVALHELWNNFRRSHWPEPSYSYNFHHCVSSQTSNLESEEPFQNTCSSTISQRTIVNDASWPIKPNEGPAYALRQSSVSCTSSDVLQF